MKTTRKYGKRVDSALTMWVKLARAFTTFSKRTADDIRTYGLTQPQFGALETLGHLGPMTIGELCRKQLVSGGNMTVVIDNLEKEDIVERVPSTKDRRATLVQLTRKGRQMFDGIFPKHAAYVADEASVLSRQEQNQLSRLLEKLGKGCRDENSKLEKNGRK